MDSNKERPEFFDRIINNQLSLNNLLEEQDIERQAFLKTISSFGLVYENTIKKCISESNNYLTNQNEHSLKDLNSCMGSIFQTNVNIQQAKTLAYNIIYHQEDYCLDDCVSNLDNQYTPPLEDCIRECIKRSYLTEKALDKELSNIINSYNSNQKGIYHYYFIILYK